MSPTVPKGAKQPADHIKAVEAEAVGDATATVEWRGLSVTVPTDPDDWPVEAMLAFEDGHVANALRAVVGPESWAALLKTRPLRRDLTDLYDTMAKSLGWDTGGE